MKRSRGLPPPAFLMEGPKDSSQLSKDGILKSDMARNENNVR